MFDKVLRLSPDKVIALIREGVTEVVPDLGTTLLKRGNENLLGEVAREIVIVYFIEAEFAFWPLMNWLYCSGFLAKNQFGTAEDGRKGSLYPFWCAMEQAIDPPPWWHWRESLVAE